VSFQWIWIPTLTSACMTFSNCKCNTVKVTRHRWQTEISQISPQCHQKLTCNWEINIMLRLPVIILCALNDNQMSGKVDTPSKCTGSNQHLKHAKKRPLLLCAKILIKLVTHAITEIHTFPITSASIQTLLSLTTFWQQHKTPLHKLCFDDCQADSSLY